MIMNTTHWTTERALEVYRTVFPDDKIYPGRGDTREKEIVEEMNDVKTAESLLDAAKVISWWYCDDAIRSMDAARRIRRFK